MGENVNGMEEIDAYYENNTIWTQQQQWRLRFTSYLNLWKKFQNLNHSYNNHKSCMGMFLGY